MKRRVWLESVASLSLACCSTGAWAQTGPKKVGYLGPPGPDRDGLGLLGELRTEMHRLGWVDGTHLRYEARLAGPGASGTSQQHLAGLARDLAAAKPDVIVAMSTSNDIAMKQANLPFPVVFLAEKPVENGLVASLAKPGGNLTGMTYHIESLLMKRMQLLKQAAPELARVGYLSINSAAMDASVRAAAKALNLEVELIEVRKAEDFEQAISRTPPPDGWIIDDYALFGGHEERIVELVARTRKPAAFSDAEWVRKGGACRTPMTVTTSCVMSRAMLTGSCGEASQPIFRWSNRLSSGLRST